MIIYPIIISLVLWLTPYEREELDPQVWSKIFTSHICTNGFIFIVQEEFLQP